MSGAGLAIVRKSGARRQDETNPGLRRVTPELTEYKRGESGIVIVPIADVNRCAARVNVFARVHASKWEARGGNIPLSLGDLRTDMPDEVINAHDDAFRTTGEVAYSPMPGEIALRNVVAGNAERIFRISGVKPEHILPIPGSRFGEFAFLDIFYRSVSGSVLIIGPCWATGPQQALHTGGPERLVEAMLPPDERALFGRMTPAMLEGFLDLHPTIRALFITNPDNPTGRLATDTEMLEYARIIAERRLFVLEDMTYGYATFGNFAASLQHAAERLPEGQKRTLLEHVVTILGLQKLVGSGLRVSAVVTRNIDFLNSITGLLSLTTGPVNKPAQVAAAAYYSNGYVIDAANATLKERRLALALALERARTRLYERYGMQIFGHTLGPVANNPNTTGGGYYAVMQLKPRAISIIATKMGHSNGDGDLVTADTIMEFFAREAGVTGQPGATMRLDDNHVRLAFGVASTKQIGMLEDRLVNAFG